MGARELYRLALAGGTLLLSAGFLFADGVKLDGGGSLSGSVLTSSKSVSVRTSSGALVVFDRAAVKQVVHGRNPAAKAGSNTANSQPKRRKLTPEEEAWMPKVHSLVSRRFGSDRERARQAHNQLLEIDDPEAIPALSTYLANTHNEEARHLYVVILHNMKGPRPVYYLVALSLYDPSPQIRSEARKAFREDQLDSARLLYIAALRSGPQKLKRIAAIGIGEIGDPRGDSVPYLINALVSYGTIGTITEPSQYGVLYVNTIYATPGLKLNDPSLIYVGQTTGTSTMPVYLGGPGMSNAQAAAAMKGMGPAQSVPNGATMSLPNPFGGQVSQDFNPSRGGAPNVQARGSGTYAITPAVADTYQQPIVGMVAPPREKKLKGRADHPEVLDSLLKVTDQKYPGHGFDQDRWRRWWANEKANRDLQKPTADRPISSGAAAP